MAEGARPAHEAAETRAPAIRRRWLPQWRPRNVARLFTRAVASFRPLSGIDHHAAVRLWRAERRGLQLAILCRTVGFAVAGVFYVVSLYLSNGAPALEGVLLLLALTGLGVAHFIIIGTRFDRPWLKFVTAAVDVLVICALVATLPLSLGSDIPQIHAYRSFNVHLLFPFVALAALSLSPRLVMWTGMVAALGWGAAFVAIVLGMETTISWSAMPARASLEEYEAVLLSPDFIGRGTRMVETLSLVIATAILALAVARARHVFIAQVRAEEERERERAARARITRQLGRFVPSAIARRLIEDPSGLAPQVRHGAVLVMDIEDFTAFADGRDPAHVIAELNTFLAACADRVSAYDGVVISFTGDGLLATFNTPLEVAEPERAALAAARELVAFAPGFGFRVRAGLAAGPIAAGSVGSAQRQAFTVYGDTVNRAARLEALAKAIGGEILADDAVRAAEPAGMEPRGAHPLRGFGEAVVVWSVPLREGRSQEVVDG